MTNEYDDLINEESSSQSLKPTNEYDDFFKEESTFKKQEVQQNIYHAKDKLPDQQAEYLKLSKELNMPLGVVERNYDRLKKKKEIETVDYDGLVKKNPSVSNWLSKPENAAIGHDDIDSLKRVETYSKFRLPQPKKTFREELEASLPAQYVPAAQTGMNNLSAGTVALAASFGKMNKEDAAAYIANFASLNQDIQNKIPSFAKEFQEVMAKEGEEFDNAASELADKYYNLEKDFGLNTLKEFGSGAINTVGEGLGYFYELGSRPKGLAYMSIENLTRMTPSFIAGALGAKAGASIALLAGQAGPQAATPEEIATVPLAATVGAGTGFFISNTAIETGAWLQDKVLKRVKDPTNQDQILAVLNDEKFMAEIQGEALRKGVTTAAVDTMFSLVAGSFLAKSKIGQTQGVLPKVGVAAKEVGQELAVQTTGEMLSEFGGQVAAFKGDISQVSPSDVLAEGMLSMGTSVVDVAMGVSRRAYYDTKAFKAAEQVAQDTKIAFESAQNAEMLDQLNGAIVESKVAQRSPEAIGDLIATATQGQAEAVFFQDDEWDSYWTSRGESPSQKLTEITGDPTLHQRVKNEGVDLVIPLKDYMTKLAGTDDINQLNKLARVSPDSMNLAEAREHFKDLNATVKDIASEADAQIAEVNKVKEMQDRFYNEYKATGVRPEQAKSYAVMNTSFYETMASRLDMPVDELYKLYPLRISSEAAQVESVGEFSQRIQDKDFLINNSKKLKEEGFTFFESEDMKFDEEGNEIDSIPIGEIGSEFTVYVQDPTGNDIGQASFKIDENGDLVPNDFNGDREAVTVDASFRRKGIATELYRLASEVTGKPVSNKNWQTDLGKKFRERLREIDSDTFFQSSQAPTEKERAEAAGFDTSKVLYHGGAAKITNFKTFPKGINKYLEGVYMTPSMNEAERYADIVKSNKKESEIYSFYAPKGLLNLDIESEVVAAIEKMGLEVPKLPKSKQYKYNPEMSHLMLMRIAVENSGVKNKQIDKVLRDKLIEAGYPGLVTDNDLVTVVFDPKSVRSIDAEFKDLTSTNIFAQEGKRGKISFFKSEEARRGAVMELMKAKDFSTALHESGHFFLEVMADLNDQENTPQEIKDDFKIIMDWMGVSDRSQIGVEQHEMWAETVEAYFMTGNAPSNKLKKIFNQFKAWLVSIYRNLGPQRAKLTPEIKSVMDRLLATEIEIEQAKDQVNFKPMFGKDLEKFGLTGEKAKRYKDAVIAAEDAAGEILTARLLEAKKIKEQKEWKEREQAEREAVTEQVNSLKVYKTIDAIKEKRDDGTNLKLSKDSLLKYIDQEDLKKLKGLYTVDGGMDVAEASGLFGYADSIEMIDDLLKSGKKKEVIEAMTQARLAEKYPEVDPFFDEKKMNEESLAAVHNEHREKLMEMELEILFEQNKPVVKDMIRQTAKRPPKSKDVKAIAEKIIGRLTLENIRPVVYERSEAKAAKLAGEALAKGDLNKAYEFKKKEQVNYYLYKEALRAKEEIKKAKQSFKKVNKKDADLAKSRDVNFVNAARALLARFGISRANKTSQEYLNSMSKYDPAAYDTMMTLVDSVESQATSVEQMTFEEFKVLKDTVDALWEMAKTSREIEVDGRKMSKEDAIAQLSELILKNAKPGVRPGYEKAMTKWEKVKMDILSFRAGLMRVEAFFDSFGDDNAFKRIIFYPIKEATNKYRVEKVAYMKEFRELLRPIEKSLTGKEIKGTEINYTFKDKAELLGAMLHTGNVSNKQKLLRGRGWGELDENNNLISNRWDDFVGRMITEGVLTKADFDFMQNVWDLFERTKPMAQKAHKAMYGHYFDEVTADEFSFGFPDGEVKKYRGGYMPAKADPNIVEDASIRQEKDALEKFNNSYAFPTTGRGATKKRVEEYAAPLIFDLRQVPQHLDWVLRFSIIEPRVKDAAKIIMDSEFRNTLAQLDPAVGSNLLVPWLQRAATQVVEEPTSKDVNLITKGAKLLRSRTGLGIMMGNIVNTFQQVTGFSVAAIKVKRKHLRNAAWRYINNSKVMSQAAADKSEFMKTRVATQVFDVSREVEELLLNPTKYEKAKDFAAKHGYFLQQHAQNIVDNIVWAGAYEQAVEAGKDETQAVRDADEAVRLTQGSFDPEDLSKFESGTALRRFFTMFYSFFNGQSNLLGSQYVRIMRNGGIGKNKGRALYVYTMGFMMPAVVAELIVKGAGADLDEDDDDEYLDDVIGLFFGSQIRYGTAMFPFIGPAIQTGINSFNDKWYDDRISTSPAVSMLESTVRSPYSIYKSLDKGEIDKRAVKDTLTAIQIITGLPTMTLARPASYLIDVETGKANPTGPIDFTRGLITGKSGE